MNHTLSCLSTTTLDTLPTTQLLGSCGQEVSGSKTGYLPVYAPSAAAAWPTIRGTKLTAIEKAASVKTTSHTFLFVLIIEPSLGLRWKGQTPQPNRSCGTPPGSADVIRDFLLTSRNRASLHQVSRSYILCRGLQVEPAPVM